MWLQLPSIYQTFFLKINKNDRALRAAISGISAALGTTFIPYIIILMFGKISQNIKKNLSLTKMRKTYEKIMIKEMWQRILKGSLTLQKHKEQAESRPK